MSPPKKLYWKCLVGWTSCPKNPTSTQKNFISPKETYISVKTPYTSTNEPYITAKEPYISAKRHPLRRTRLEREREQYLKVMSFSGIFCKRAQLWMGSFSVIFPPAVLSPWMCVYLAFYLSRRVHVAGCVFAKYPIWVSFAKEPNLDGLISMMFFFGVGDSCRRCIYIHTYTYTYTYIYTYTYTYT